MKGDRPLTPEQRVLVEQNMPLVHWTVRRYMDVKENICGLGFEDLCQEGALALCYAAATYVAGKAQFKSYAITVIRNHLLDHCRRIAAQLKNAPTYPLMCRTGRTSLLPCGSGRLPGMIRRSGFRQSMLLNFWSMGNGITAG